MDYNNIYNILETGIISAVREDAWLGDTRNIRLIHTKLRDDLSSYRGHEVPAIAVEVRDVVDEANKNNSIFTEDLNVLVEVTCSGSDRSNLDTQVKEIIARIRSWYRNAIRTYGPDNLFLDDRDVIPTGNGEVAFMGGEQENVYVQVGYTVLEMKVINKS